MAAVLAVQEATLIAVAACEVAPTRTWRLFGHRYA